MYRLLSKSPRREGGTPGRRGIRPECLRCPRQARNDPGVVAPGVLADMSCRRPSAAGWPGEANDRVVSALVWMDGMELWERPTQYVIGKGSDPRPNWGCPKA